MEAIRGFYENYIRWSAASMTLSDVLEIAIFTYFIYHIILWIKQSKAWILLKGAAGGQGAAADYRCDVDFLPI